MLPVDSTRAFEYLWYIWRIFGIHPPDGDTFWTRHYTAYAIVINIFSNICVPLSFYIECLLSSSLAEFSENFYVVAVVITEQVKFFNAWYMIGRFKNLHMTLQQLDNRLQSNKEHHIIRDHIRQSKRNFVWILRLFSAIVTSSVLITVCTDDQELAAHAWYPWDWKSSNRVYWWTVGFQTLSIVSLCMMAVINDTYPMSYLTMVAGHYKARSQGNINVSYFYLYLLHYLFILRSLRLVDTIQDALSSVFFVQFTCTALSMCTLTYFVFFVKLSMSKLFHLFFNFIGVAIETFIICYAAEAVSDSAEHVCQAVYNCNWLDQSIKFQRTLILVLKRSQRPIIIMAARLLPVRMTTFLAVGKTAYSMFTMLNNIKSKS
ncbi:odorant receptor 19a-like [Drosophila innubila]|uniref:odorant receptor 19a-like n=1 Tax=Drosophila innubila TaxID=198719 RepID=UPI00148D2628|nr:odorant receptor 19a-like [Drosophila innubila]